MSDKPSRCFLYSLDAPAGQIFEGADAIAAALEDGWVDTPAKLEEPAPKKAAAKPTGGAKKVATNDNSK